MTDLLAHRDDLRRRIDADDEAATAYETKAAELRHDAELARAELRGLELALEGQRLVPRRPFPLTANFGD